MMGNLRPDFFRFDPPALSSETLTSVVSEFFGIRGSLTPMRGERDQNVLVTTTDATEFVLKVASPSEDPETIEFQCRALVHIESTDPTLPVPRLVRTREGGLVARVELADAEMLVRVLTYLPGDTFDEAGSLSLTGLRGVGAFQGRLARALAEFAHPAASNFMPWALDSGLLAAEQLWENLPAESRAVVEPCRPRLVEATRRLRGARRQVIHNDGHRGNLIRPHAQSEHVTGVIDFGDLVDTALVADLGISGASFLGDQPDPSKALGVLAEGFDRYVPLRDDEIALLPELVLSRLALSTLLTEYQINHTPHLAAAVAAERPGLLADLSRWRDLDPLMIAEQLHDHLRHARAGEKR